MSIAEVFSLLNVSSPKPPVIVSTELPPPPSRTSSNGEPIRRSAPLPPFSTRASMFTAFSAGSGCPIGVPRSVASIVSLPPSASIVSVSPKEVLRTVFAT
jgi:hypothetical protein